MLDIKLIERGLKKPGKTKGGLANAMGVRAGAVSEIFSGIRLIKASEIDAIVGYLELNSVPIMGRVGAGACLELPQLRAVPDVVRHQVAVRFPVEQHAARGAQQTAAPSHRELRSLRPDHLVRGRVHCGERPGALEPRWSVEALGVADRHELLRRLVPDLASGCECRGDDR